MLLATSILGRADEPRFATKRVERLMITFADASKRRLRGRTDAGTDVAIDLPRGSYIEDGVVLVEDGERIVIAAREPEDALVIRLSPLLDRAEVARHAVLVGHAFGNQHVPVEVVDGDIRVPITTSREIAAATVERLDLDGAALSFELVRLGRSRPFTPQHPHHPDSHARGDDPRSHR